MPAAAYSQYKDPETGEIMWIPQLFPHANIIGEMSSTEIESWVSAGIIPKDLYESDLQNNEKMQEIRNKLENGEQVFISELPPHSCTLTQYLLKNKARLYGENILTKIFSRLDDRDADIVWLSFVKEALTSIVSEDPLHIHFHVARKTLKDKYNIDDSRAVDILARDIVEHCGNILSKFKSFNHPAFNKNPIDPTDLEDHLEHENGGIAQIDIEFVGYLKGLGVKGKKLATIVERNSRELFLFYKAENFSSSCRRSLWGLWVTDKNDQENKEPVFLQLLSQALWEDQCGRLWNRQANQVAAISKPVIEIIKPVLSSTNKKKIVQQDNQVMCCDQSGSPIFYAPTIDPEVISLLQKGVKSLSTLTGHKLLRWQIKTAFEKWAQGDKDPRIIEIDGGFTAIADQVGCNSTKEISKIKEILHVQAFGQFVFADGSRGNMIILRVLERYRNAEPSKISMVLGDMLLPNFIFKLDKNTGRRLIPIGDLPPLQGSNNTHAFQAQLQLLVFEEFSNQSDRIAAQGAAIIPMNRWREMATESGVNPERVGEVINHWCQPDLINCFLERQGDEYALASYYDNAQKFLVDQGQRRIKASLWGKASAEKRKGK